MNTFILVIATLCSQPGVGHGKNTSTYLSRENAFAAQSACTKRLFKACTETHAITRKLLPKDASCLVENL